MRSSAEQEALMRTLRLVAPGTSLYEGLENILRARTGALIVVGDSEEVMKIVNGGFRLNTEMDPANLYELAKMDGAIILSNEAKRIIVANAHLTPDPMIPTTETGTRHRTAERAAIQTGELVIAISQRRNIITLYRGDQRYVLREIGNVLTKANQALQTLERYRKVLQQALINLSALEFEDQTTLADVCTVIQRSEMAERIAGEIEMYISELGTEGRLVSMQLEELLSDIEDEGLFVIKDYTVSQEEQDHEEAMEELQRTAGEELLDPGQILRILGYSLGMSPESTVVTTRGYRILHKIPRLPGPVIENLVRVFDGLQRVLGASTEALDDVEGIGEIRARVIKDGLRRLREQVLLERHL